MVIRASSSQHKNFTFTREKKMSKQNLMLASKRFPTTKLVEKAMLTVACMWSNWLQDMNLAECLLSHLQVNPLSIWIDLGHWGHPMEVRPAGGGWSQFEVASSGSLVVLLGHRWGQAACAHHYLHIDLAAFGLLFPSEVSQWCTGYCHEPTELLLAGWLHPSRTPNCQNTSI